MPPATLEKLTAEVLRLKQQGSGSVPRVRLFGAGQHREGEPAYTRQEIARILKNFQTYSASPNPRLPVNIGLDHVQGGSFGGPSVGRVTDLSIDSGGVLVARFDNLPKLYAQAIDQGLWSRISCEIDDDLPFGFEGQGPVLSGVTLLGLKQPQLQWTDDLTGKVKYARWRWRSERRPKGRRVYSEAYMDESTKDTLKALIKGKWPDLPDEVIDSLDDEQLNMFAKAVAGPPPEEMSGDAMAVPPPRDEMIDAIIAVDPAQDRATLEAMPDEELVALWREVTGASEFAATTEGTTMTATPPKPAEPTGPAEPMPSPKPPLSPQPKPAPKPPPPSATVGPKQFAALAARARRLEVDMARREKAERERTVRAHCERWSRDGFVTPAEVDPKSTTPNVYHRLMAASTVRSRLYGAKSLNEFDAAVAEIEARGPRYTRLFSEQVPQADATVKNHFDAIREKARADRAARRGPSEATVAERLKRISIG